MTDWNKCWTLPQHKIRKDQIEILDEIEYAIDQGYHNIILEAGTGIGKSAIATTISNRFNNNYILTMTTQLQQQYLEDFPFLTSIKGRKKFTCLKKEKQTLKYIKKLLEEIKKLKLDKDLNNTLKKRISHIKILVKNRYALKKINKKLEEFIEELDNEDLQKLLFTLHELLINLTCDPCFLAGTKKEKCIECEYLQAFKKAQASKQLITNYNYLYYAGNYAKTFSPRELLVLDESHNLEAKLMSLVSKELPRKSINDEFGIDIFKEVVTGENKLQDLNHPGYWLKKLKKLIKLCNTRLENLEANRKHYPEQEYYKTEQNLINHKKYFKELVNNLKDESTRWIINVPLKTKILANKKGLKAEFKPLTIEEYGKCITQFGDFRLFMTGTLGNWKHFCKWIGLDIQDTYYIYKKSPFPVENRPIIKKYVCSMKGRRNGIANWRNYQAIRKIKEILKEHENVKGVIHTSSNEQAWYIISEIGDERLLEIYGNEREKILNKFRYSQEPLVLVGAGIKDGVDFKDDLCRFQIIYKVPFPALQGQTLIRKNYDVNWYIHQTVMPLMQAYGRGVRDINDYCTTYILDKDFERVLRNNKDLFNEYFLEAVQ